VIKPTFDQKQVLPARLASSFFGQQPSTGGGEGAIASFHPCPVDPPLIEPRHTASTSMYSLTFCVRPMSPERHHWKPAV